jgi:hypothetical protein
MKKFLSILLVFLLVVSFAGCTKNNKGEKKKEEKQEEEKQKQKGDLVINGYDLSLTENGSFDKLSFKYPTSGRVVTSIGTAEVIGVEAKDGSDTFYLRIIFGSMYGTKVENGMPEDTFTLVETKEINGINWYHYNDKEGRNHYALNYDYTNYVIGFDYTDSALDKFVDEFIKTVTINK